MEPKARGGEQSLGTCDRAKGRRGTASRKDGCAYGLPKEGRAERPRRRRGAVGWLRMENMEWWKWMLVEALMGSDSGNLRLAVCWPSAEGCVAGGVPALVLNLNLELLVVVVVVVVNM